MLIVKLAPILAFFLAFCLLSISAIAQEFPGQAGGDAISEKVFASLSGKSSDISDKITKSGNHYLSKLQKQEQKLKAKMWKKDSLLAKQMFAGIEEKYAALKNTSGKLSKYSNVYSGHLDTLTTALNFLKAQKINVPELQKNLTQLSALQAGLNKTEAVKQFLTERKQLLKESLEKLGLLKELKGFQKQAYYYCQQVREYRAMWEDPSKLERKLVEWVMTTEKFKGFFREHSQLATLFALPGGNTSTASLQGLQTRASVQQGIQDRFGTGPQVQQMVQQNVQAAQGQLSELKNKLSQYGSGTYGNSSADIEMPEGFKPNGQKTKSFLKRLEYGLNIQSQKARSYFPVTSDLGLSLGYRLNDNSSVGVGASYKLGWGRGWNRIRLTSEGLGLRSYVDMRLKGSLYLSGGYEQNYRTAFNSIQQLKNYSSWQSSGLLGLSKKYKVSKKLKGEMKLLWDFLSYQQVPKTQAVLFRLGYNLR